MVGQTTVRTLGEAACLASLVLGDFVHRVLAALGGCTERSSLLGHVDLQSHSMRQPPRSENGRNRSDGRSQTPPPPRSSNATTNNIRAASAREMQHTNRQLMGSTPSTACSDQYRRQTTSQTRTIESSGLVTRKIPSREYHGLRLSRNDGSVTRGVASSSSALIPLWGTLRLPVAIFLTIFVEKDLNPNTTGSQPTLLPCFVRRLLVSSAVAGTVGTVRSIFM